MRGKYGGLLNYRNAPGEGALYLQSWAICCRDKYPEFSLCEFSNISPIDNQDYT